MYSAGQEAGKDSRFFSLNKDWLNETLINSYLTTCAGNKVKPTIDWRQLIAPNTTEHYSGLRRLRQLEEEKFRLVES